jgi:type I restriction enzyme, S subunit
MKSLALMPKYREYKKAPIDWIDSIPSHWGLKRFKFLLKEINIRSTTGDEQLLSLSKYKGIVPKESLAERAGAAESLIGYKKVFINDLVINKMQAVNGLLAVSKLEGITSPDYSVYRPINPELLDYRYLGYLLSMPEYLGEFKRRVKGVMEGFIRLYTDDLFSICSILPTVEEQNLIANFLDKKMVQIDGAIAIKEEQINLLKERKQIIIQQTVTRGLKPNVSLKQTELSWAPEIASHWSLLPNRLFMKMRRVQVGQAHKDFQLLSLTKQGVLVRDVSTGAGKQSDFLERMQEVRKGDLIFCLFDVEETPRTVGLSQCLGMISADYTIFECVDEPTGRFLEYFYKNTDDQKLLKPLYKGLRNRIPKPRFLRTNCPMPPKEELMEILQYLDDLEVNTTNATAIILSQIKKIQEYKTTLISSAVSGKIKITPEMIEG